MKTKSKFFIHDKTYTTRTAKKSDRDFVLNLYKKTLFKYVAAYHTPSIAMFDKRFCRDYKERKIIMRGTRRIGLFQLTKRSKTLAITGLFLSPAYHGKGIGRYLMTYFEEVAKKRTCSKLELQVWDNNPAKNFYKKLGYTIVSRKNHKYTMQKNI